MVENTIKSDIIYDPVKVKTENEEETLYKQQKTKKKFPLAVILIIFNEFCERFSYSGMRAFLALYLKQKLLYTDDEATEIYHAFTTFVYFFPIFGAILADSYFGKFRTILYLMVIYGIGNITLAITAIPPLHIPGREFTMLGLLLVAIGAGGIKPCVSAFGGDQFVLPEQEKQLTIFFSLFYFCISVGSLIAKTVAPLLRSEVQCYGDKDCYSFAFGAPGVLIVTSIVTFYCAKRMYIIKKPKSNVVMDVVRCISVALKTRMSSKNEKTHHWLDYAREYYEQNFIDDVKRTLRIFVLFAPLPVFWSLLDQLGSRWTLQASKMDGQFGSFTVKPDQMQVLCPILILILIPVLNKVIYPALAKYNLFCNHLHRLLAGCILAAVAYICAGILETHLEKTYPILPSEEYAQMRIFNGHGCDLHFTSQNGDNNFTIHPYDYYEDKFLVVKGKEERTFIRTVKCLNSSKITNDTLIVEENKAISFFYAYENKNNSYIRYVDKNEKPRSGFPYVRLLSNAHPEKRLNVTLYNIQRKNIEVYTNSTFTNLIEVFADHYDLYINSRIVFKDLKLRIGGVYTIIMEIDENNLNANLLTITEPNSISMIFVLPQMIIVSTAEVLFAVTGLEFAFREAPDSMKSVLQAYWYLVEAFGNIIIIFVTRVGSNYSQVTQYFFYASLMFVSTIVFFFLSKWHNVTKNNNDNERYDLKTNCNRIPIREL